MSAGWMTRADVAAVLGVHTNYVTRLLNEGLPHLRLGNHVRIRPDDLEAFLAARILRAGGGDDGTEVRDGIGQPTSGRPVGGSTPRRQRRVPVRQPGGPVRGPEARGTGDGRGDGGHRVMVESGMSGRDDGEPNTLHTRPARAALPARGGRFLWRVETPMATLSEYFWERVQKTEGCWWWTGHIDPNGYGRLTIPRAEQTLGGSRLAPRASWELHHGAIPEGLFICHHCDNPSCVRPDHLFVGTSADNLADAMAKGRHARRDLIKPVPPPRPAPAVFEDEPGDEDSGYTTNEAATLLGLSPKTVRRQIENGAITATKRGRDWWVTPAEVERYRRDSLGKRSPRSTLNGRQEDRP